MMHIMRYHDGSEWISNRRCGHPPESLDGNAVLEETLGYTQWMERIMNFHKWYDSINGIWRLTILLAWMSILTIAASVYNPMLGSLWGLFTIVLIISRIHYLNSSLEK